jgi:hypothetical protein
MLHSSEHLLGRIVKEASCQFESPNVSARHCAIYRKLLGPDGQNVPPNHIQGPGDRLVTCIKDFRYDSHLYHCLPRYHEV